MRKAAVAAMLCISACALPAHVFANASKPVADQAATENMSPEVKERLRADLQAEQAARDAGDKDALASAQKRVIEDSVAAGIIKQPVTATQAEAARKAAEARKAQQAQQAQQAQAPAAVPPPAAHHDAQHKKH